MEFLKVSIFFFLIFKIQKKTGIDFIIQLLAI